MKNEKAFTLAEILGIIVIIGLLLIIVSPFIIGKIKENITNVDNVGNKLIYNAAQQIIDEDSEKYPKGKSYCIGIEELIKKGKLTSPVIDITTGEDIEEKSVLVKMSITGKIDYDILEKEECEEQVEEETEISTVTFPSCRDKEYTGSEQILFKARLTGRYTNSALKGTDVGNYTVDLMPSSNYQWDSGDNVTSERTLTCKIIKSETTTSMPEVVKTFNNSNQAASGAVAKLNSNDNVIPNANFTYTYFSGDSCQGEALTAAPKTAGIYSVKATLEGTSNYNSSESPCVKYTMNKYEPTLALSETTGTVTYNSERTFDITPTVITACKGTLKATSANTSNVTISSGAETSNATSKVSVKWKGILKTTDTKININYTPADTNNCANANQVQYQAVVNTLTPTVTLTAKTGLVYNGSAQAANTATVSPNTGGTVTYTYYTNSSCTTKTAAAASSGSAASEGAAPKAAGTWYVKATVAAVTNKTNAASSSCVAHSISKATPTMTLSSTSGTIIGKNSASVTVNYNGDGKVTTSSNATTYATASPATVTISSGKGTVTITGANETNEGTAKITVSAAAGTNYKAASAIYTVSKTAANYYINNIGSGKLHYQQTLWKSVDASAANATIKILNNTTESTKVSIEKNLTINTNGKTLTRSNVIEVNSANLTISGSGGINNTSTGHVTIWVNGTGKIATSGTPKIQSIKSCIHAAGSSNIDLAGGYIYSTRANAVENEGSGWTHIKDTKVYAPTRTTNAVRLTDGATGNLVINGSSIIGSGTSNTTGIDYTTGDEENRSPLSSSSTGTIWIQDSAKIYSGEYGGHAVSCWKACTLNFEDTSGATTVSKVGVDTDSSYRAAVWFDDVNAKVYFKGTGWFMTKGKRAVRIAGGKNNISLSSGSHFISRADRSMFVINIHNANYGDLVGDAGWVGGSSPTTENYIWMNGYNSTKTESVSNCYRLTVP